MVELLTLVWLFHTTQPATSALTSQSPQAAFAAPANPTNGFTVRFTADFRRVTEPRTILAIPDVLAVRLRPHDPRDRDRQNYPAFPFPDGSVPVLEATLTLHSTEHPDWRDLTIGIPLALLERPEGRHEVVLHFTGVRWSLFVDGTLLDNEFPFGSPRWAEPSGWRIEPDCVTEARLDLPALQPEVRPAPKPRRAPGIQYWLPPGHNTWVGDVAAIHHAGRYHVFYLFDRRHHQSKFGCGAHYFEHLSTRDFRTWTEHEAATPLEEQWECIGTGTPFVFEGRLGLSYGLHTTRVYPDERTTLPAQRDYLKSHGRTGAFPRTTTPGFPAGSTYAVSADGVASFRKTGVMFHPCENPSVYTDPAGRLRMMANYRAKGTWAADTVDGGWRCVNPDFPPGGDCTFFFRWGRFDYVIGGFTGLWMKPADAPDGAYADMVRQGLDFYDGSNVPSVTPLPDGRCLMAAWIPIRGWGGNLLLRELVQYPDGRIGSKWMKEIVPATGATRTLPARAVDGPPIATGGRSFLLSFEVRPVKGALQPGRLGVSLLPEAGDTAACEWQLDAAARRAQFGKAVPVGFAAREKSLREGGAPQQVGHYALENLVGIDRPFAVRLLVKGSDKLGGSLVDAEIAGQRTMITYQPGLTVQRLGFRTEGVELRRVRLAPLTEP